MHRVRLIARLDIKGPNLIKGIHLEGVRKIGDPWTFAYDYYRAGIDEILYIDAVASLYGRNSLDEIVAATASEIFIPITVGGGIRSVDDAQRMLRAGADKIAVNSEATRSPDLIDKIAERFGSQCVVLSIQAKRRGSGSWEAYRDGGREHTGRDVIEWAREAQDRGAGEILLTSVDREGTGEGFDVELTQSVASAVTIPVIASGGLGTTAHVAPVVEQGAASAIAVAQALHYGKLSVRDIRRAALDAGFDVRVIESAKKTRADGQ